MKRFFRIVGVALALVSTPAIAQTAISAKQVTVDGIRLDSALSNKADAAAVSIALADKAPTKAVGWVSTDVYGADPTGVACSDTAISQALAAGRGPIIAGANRSRVVLLGAGAYRLCAPVVISTTNTILRGQGQRKTALVIDQTSGPGISLTAEGDSGVEALSILSSTTREAAGASDALSGIISESGATTGTYRIKLLDLEILSQPGSGIIAYAPELMEIKRLNANSNRGSAGVLIDGRAIRNLSNEIGQLRLRDNAGWGLIVRHMTAQDISTVEGLNNKLGQLWLDDTTSSMLRGLDLEAFDLRSTDATITGMLITGRGNTVIGGNYYSLGQGVRLVSAPGTTIIQPAFAGKDASNPIVTAVSLDGSSSLSNIDLATGTNVSTPVADASLNSMVRLNGYPLGGTYSQRKVNTSVGTTYNPDFSRASYFRLTLTGNLAIGGPSNLDPRCGNTCSQRITFEFVQPATGGPYTVSFGSNYRHSFTNSGAVAGSVTIVEFVQTSANNQVQQVAPNFWLAPQ